MPGEKWQLKNSLIGRVYFPLTATRIKRWIKGGGQANDRVWRPGFPGWRKIGVVEEFERCFMEGAGSKSDEELSEEESS